jgi:hypothetical protein
VRMKVSPCAELRAEGADALHQRAALSVDRVQAARRRHETAPVGRRLGHLSHVPWLSVFVLRESSDNVHRARVMSGT